MRWVRVEPTLVDVVGWVFLSVGITIVLVLVLLRAKYEGSFLYWGFHGFRRALDEPVQQAPGMPRTWPTWLRATVLAVAGLACAGAAWVVLGR